MPDDAELIELLELELDMLINKANKSGLSYWHILRVILSRLETLMMQVDVEMRLK